MWPWVPARISVSGMPTPIACARIKTSPALGSGTGTSSTCSTSGGPGARNWMSCINGASGSKALLIVLKPANHPLQFPWHSTVATGHLGPAFEDRCAIMQLSAKARTGVVVRNPVFLQCEQIKVKVVFRVGELHRDRRRVRGRCRNYGGEQSEDCNRERSAHC